MATNAVVVPGQNDFVKTIEVSKKRGFRWTKWPTASKNDNKNYNSLESLSEKNNKHAFPKPSVTIFKDWENDDDVRSVGTSKETVDDAYQQGDDSIISISDGAETQSNIADYVESNTFWSPHDCIGWEVFVNTFGVGNILSSTVNTSNSKTALEIQVSHLLLDNIKIFHSTTSYCIGQFQDGRIIKIDDSTQILYLNRLA